MVAADGSKANGKVRGVRKRWLIAAALIGGVAVFLVLLTVQTSQTIQTSQTSSSPRHQIYGDPAIMEAFERGDFGTALTNKADRMLAWFAQPGKLM